MANDADKINQILWSGLPRRINPDGTITIYCRNCQRPIARAVSPQIRTVQKCALCLAREAGVKDPEKHVLPSYVMFDPTQPPVPLEEGDPLLALYPETQMTEGKSVPSGGVMGTVKALFRALVPWHEETPIDKPLTTGTGLLSKVIAKSKRSKGAYER